MAATNKTTAKVDLTEQLDITTLREQILSNARFIRATNSDDMEPGYTSSGLEIVITRSDDGSFRAAVLSILEREHERNIIETILDTDISARYKTDIQALRELYKGSQGILGALRENSVGEQKLFPQKRKLADWRLLDFNALNFNK